MKQIYMCDVCKKYFDTKEEAEKCEAMHEEEMRKKNEMKSREDKINELIKNFYIDYDRLPSIKFSYETCSDGCCDDTNTERKECKCDRNGYSDLMKHWFDLLF